MSSSADDVTSRAQATDQAWGTFVRSRFEAIANNTPPMDREMRLQVHKLEFDALEKYIIYAKQSWNTCIGASSLPAEILARIFAFAQTIESWKPHIGYYPYRGRRYPDFGWIYVTHVCASWRRAAISAANLWSDISIFSLHPQMGYLVLKRSLCLPLDLTIGRPLRSSYAGQDNLFPVVQDWLCDPILLRIERLSIFTHLEEFAICAAALDRPLPTLRDLAIDLSWKHNIVGHLKYILGDRCPSLLSRLSLKNCTLPALYSGLISGGLTYLSLAMTDSVKYDLFWMTMSEFRSQLALMPNLEELRFSNVLPYASEAEEPPLVFPPTFRKLHVECSTQLVFSSCYSTFWTHSQFPDTTSIVSVVSVRGLASATERAIDALTEINPSGPPPVELWISQDSMKVYFVERQRAEWTRYCTEREFSIEPLPSTSVWTEDAKEGRHLNIIWALARNYTSQIAFAPIRVLNLSLEAVHAFNNSDDPAGLWLSKFGMNRLVKRISVPYRACGKLLNALTQRDAETGALRLFPLLEVIVLYTSPPGYSPISKPQDVQSPDVALIYMLRSRRDLGVPVKELLVAREVADLSVWQNVGEETVVSFYD